MNSWLLAAGAVILLFLLALGRARLDYRIGRRHLKVLWFGICVRRIPLADIDSISKRPRGWAEHWENTWRSSHHILVIHRRRGWFKEIIITPDYRYAFWSELEKAVEKHGP